MILDEYNYCNANSLTSIINEISILKGGFSSSILLKTNIDNYPYVIRLLSSSRNKYFYNNTQDEITNINLANKSQITPKLYYTNNKDKIILMEYINNRKLTSTEIYSPNIISKLAKKIKSIHSLPTLNSKYYFMTEFENALNLISQQKNFNKLNHIIMFINDNEQILKRHMSISPTHNDLNFNNILYDGNFHIIDWEASGMGDKYLDLATIINFYIHSPEMENIFLYSYFNRNITQKERAYLEIMKIKSLCLYGLKIFRRIKEPKTIKKFKSLKINKFHELTKKLILGEEVLSDKEVFVTYGISLFNEAYSRVKSKKTQGHIELLKKDVLNEV